MPGGRPSRTSCTLLSSRCFCMNDCWTRVELNSRSSPRRKGRKTGSSHDPTNGPNQALCRCRFQDLLMTLTNSYGALMSRRRQESGPTSFRLRKRESFILPRSALMEWHSWLPSLERGAFHTIQRMSFIPFHHLQSSIPNPKWAKLGSNKVQVHGQGQVLFLHQPTQA